jgi:hypothetical protein
MVRSLSMRRSTVLMGILTICVCYAQPGDRMTLTFDTASKKITSLREFNTYMGQAKDAVTLQVQMASLPGGTDFAERTVFNASAKELGVTATNSNCQKL